MITGRTGLSYKPGGFLRSPRLTTYALYFFLIFVILKRQINDDDDDDDLEDLVEKSMNVRLFKVYTLFQNGRHFSILWFTCKLALVASFKGKYSFEFRV